MKEKFRIMYKLNVQDTTLYINPKTFEFNTEPLKSYPENVENRYFEVLGDSEQALNFSKMLFQYQYIWQLMNITYADVKNKRLQTISDDEVMPYLEFLKLEQEKEQLEKNMMELSKSAMKDVFLQLFEDKSCFFKVIPDYGNSSYILDFDGYLLENYSLLKFSVTDIMPEVITKVEVTDPQDKAKIDALFAQCKTLYDNSQCVKNLCQTTSDNVFNNLDNLQVAEDFARQVRSLTRQIRTNESDLDDCTYDLLKLLHKYS